MKSLNLFTALLLSLLISSCVEDYESETGAIPKVEVFFLKDCNREPVVGKELMFKRTYNPNFLTKRESSTHGPYITDENGYVKVELEELRKATRWSFLELNGEEYLASPYTYRPSNQSNKPATVMPNAWVTHTVTLINTGETTANDTLYLGASRDRIDSTHIGPFPEGFTFERRVKPNRGLSSNIQYSPAMTAEIDFFWGIGRTDFYSLWVTSNQVPPNYLRKISQTVCGQGGEVIIDLRDYPK